MRVGAQLDEAAAKRVAERSERLFNDAGARAGRGFGQSFEQQVETALTEKSVEKSARKIEAMMARTGKTSAEALNQAIASEAERTGLGADKIGEHLKQRLGVHGTSAGQQFTAMFMGELGKVAPGVSNLLGTVGSVGSTAMEAIGGSSVAAVAGVAAVGAAAITATVKLYGIGEEFDNVARRVEIQTGKMGGNLKELTESIDHVAVNTAASLDQIGGIAGSVSQAFHVTGAPLEVLTKQIADLNQMTGEPTNVRDLGKVMRAFGMDANQAGAGLDELKTASENTGAPVGELLETLKSVGASARSLHLDFGQTAAIIDMFDQAGLDAATSTRGLNKAIGEATKQHIDLQTVLQTSIEDIGKFLAAGDEQKAQEMAQKLFGTKGAQQFVDAIRQGKLNAEDLNNSLKTTANAGHIEKLRDDTLRWADTWQIVKNRIEDALKPLAEPVFDGLQKGLLFLTSALDIVHAPSLPSGVGPVDKKPLASIFPGAPGGPGTPGGLPPGWKLGPGGIPMPGPNTGTGNPDGPQPDLSDQIDDSGTPKPVHLPYGPGYGAAPAPGESEQHWKLQQDVIEKQHDLAEKRATLDEADKSHLVKEEEKIRLRNDVAKAQTEADTAGRALTNYRPKVEVPYDPRYGAAPRPGEPEKLYGAEQGMLEAQHKRAEAQATLNQLESQAGATNEDKIKARNDLAAAEQHEYEAQMKLREAALGTSKDLGQLGAAIDNDFGISKGIPGIVENLVKTMADVAAAPMLGKLAAFGNISDAQTGIQGGSGLIGMMGAQNLSEGKSALFGNPLQGPAAAAGYDSIGGGAGILGNLLGLGGPGDTKKAGQPGYAPGGAPDPASGYGGDAALLSNVPAGRYDASGDLSKGLGDCSSAVEDLVNILDGAPTAGRGMSTGNAAQWLPAHGFVPTNVPMPGSFQVGFNDHHMQATLPGGTPFNWGSDAAAANRGIGGSGAWDPAFTAHYYRPAGAGPSNGLGGAPGAAPVSGSGVVSVFVTNMPGDLGAAGLGAAVPGAAVAAAGANAASGVGPAPGPGGGGAPGGPTGGPGDITNPGLTPPGQTSFGNAPAGAPGSAPRADLAPGPPPAPNPLIPPSSPFAGGNPLAPTDTPSAYGGGAHIQPAGFNTGGAPGPAPGAAAPSATGGGARADTGGPGGTKLGGVAGPANPAGGQAGITPGGTLDSALTAAAGAFPGGGAAAQLAIKETNRAIQYGSQVAGIAAQGLMTTFIPNGGSELAQNSWLTKIFSGLAGARPETPNMAGTPAAKPVNPGKGGDTTNNNGGDIHQNVTINEASRQNGADAAHLLSVGAQNMPAMGR